MVPNVKTNIPRTTPFFNRGIRRKRRKKWKRWKRWKRQNELAKRSQFTINHHYRTVIMRALRSPLVSGACWLLFTIGTWRTIQWQFCTNMWIQRHKSLAPTSQFQPGYDKKQVIQWCPEINRNEEFAVLEFWAPEADTLFEARPFGSPMRKMSNDHGGSALNHIELQTPQQALQWKKKTVP